MERFIYTTIYALVYLLNLAQADRTICQIYGTYKTYCETGYVCCFNLEYCCLGGHTYESVHEHPELTPGVIAAIVIGSIALILIMIVIGCKVINCNSIESVTPQSQPMHVVSLPAAGGYANPEPSKIPFPDEGNMIPSQAPEYRKY